LVFTLTSQSTWAASATTRDPVRAIESRMDRYFLAPRSPETFRALSGMGLPAGANAKDGDLLWWPSGAEDKALLHSLLPAVQMSTLNYAAFGDCRLEAPMQQFKARTARLGVEHPYIAQWLQV